jgi:AraC family transcriptional regulator of adaptative response / DNA-3-methyladenine glycosylase II
VASLTAIAGLGPWTAHYIALRLGEPDAFPGTDLGVRRSLGAAGDSLATTAARWRPWRALATTHLWAASAGGQPAEAGEVARL